jgi:AraC-like DNA-binding protein
MVQIGQPDRRLPVRERPKPAGRRWSDDPDLKASWEFATLQVGGYLHELREAQGWSLDDLARASGLHSCTLEALENADTDVQLSTLVRAFMPFGRQVLVSFLAGSALIAPGYNRGNYEHPANT